MHQSLIRNGNHFIRLGANFHALYRNKWFLIDGPWFDYLEEIFKKSRQFTIILRPYHKMPSVPLIDGECLEIPSSHSEFIHWERMTIPYYGASKRIDSHCYNIERLRHYSNLVEKHSNVHINTLDLILTKYSSIPAWQCDYGIIPAWLKNPNWDEHLEELFSYIQEGYIQEGIY